MPRKNQSLPTTAPDAPIKYEPRHRMDVSSYRDKLLKKKNPNLGCFQLSEKPHYGLQSRDNRPTISSFRLENYQHPIDKELKKKNPHFGCFDLSDGQPISDPKPNGNL